MQQTLQLTRHRAAERARSTRVFKTAAMTVQTRLSILTLTWIVGGFTTATLALFVSPWFLFATAFILCVTGVLIERTRCSHCGHPLLRRHVRLGPLSIPYYWTTVPVNCGRCASRQPSRGVRVGSC
ncbi:MAG: hypothetical protein JO315_16660 [Acidobacteria bacterium]|nr:hypothetical protein [Acidobacteriota bacterium]